MRSTSIDDRPIMSLPTSREVKNHTHLYGWARQVNDRIESSRMLFLQNRDHNYHQFYWCCWPVLKLCERLKKDRRYFLTICVHWAGSNILVAHHKCNSGYRKNQQVKKSNSFLTFRGTYVKPIDIIWAKCNSKGLRSYHRRVFISLKNNRLCYWK